MIHLGMLRLKNYSLEFIFDFHIFEGEICSYNPLSNQITSKSKFHNEGIRCLIETEQNQLISSSYDKTIKLYECTRQTLSDLEKGLGMTLLI